MSDSPIPSGHWRALLEQVRASGALTEVVDVETLVVGLVYFASEKLRLPREPTAEGVRDFRPELEVMRDGVRVLCALTRNLLEKNQGLASHPAVDFQEILGLSPDDLSPAFGSFFATRSKASPDALPMFTEELSSLLVAMDAVLQGARVRERVFEGFHRLVTCAIARSGLLELRDARLSSGFFASEDSGSPVSEVVRTLPCRDVLMRHLVELAELSETLRWIEDRSRSTPVPGAVFLKLIDVRTRLLVVVDRIRSHAARELVEGSDHLLITGQSVQGIGLGAPHQGMSSVPPAQGTRGSQRPTLERSDWASLRTIVAASRALRRDVSWTFRTMAPSLELALRDPSGQEALGRMARALLARMGETLEYWFRSLTGHYGIGGLDASLRRCPTFMERYYRDLCHLRYLCKAFATRIPLLRPLDDGFAGLKQIRNVEEFRGYLRVLGHTASVFAPKAAFALDRTVTQMNQGLIAMNQGRQQLSDANELLLLELDRQLSRTLWSGIRPKSGQKRKEWLAYLRDSLLAA